jgi:hypothetical protein
MMSFALIATLAVIGFVANAFPFYCGIPVKSSAGPLSALVVEF